MGQESNIEWTDHTFNPWRGCTKVSPACENCYAETMSKRNPGVLGVWGKHGTREIAAESYWKLPLKWNREAEAQGQRKRVFCASLADVFEGSDTMPEDAWQPVYEARLRLVWLIKETPWLDWLLLTKRPELVTAIAAEIYPATQVDLLSLPNVWIGTTVENQKYADERIPALLKIPAKVRFLSVEPLLGPVDLSRWLDPMGFECPDICPDLSYLKYSDVPTKDIERDGRVEQVPFCPDCGLQGVWTALGSVGVDWVIVGGESGPDARPMHPDWVRSIRDQCTAANVPFFFKQWGEWWPMSQTPDGWSDEHPRYAKRRMILQLDGSDQGLYFPPGAMTCFKVGKHVSGRLLDGQTWDEMPYL